MNIVSLPFLALFLTFNLTGSAVALESRKNLSEALAFHCGICFNRFKTYEIKNYKNLSPAAKLEGLEFYCDHGLQNFHVFCLEMWVRSEAVEKVGCPLCNEKLRDS